MKVHSPRSTVHSSSILKGERREGKRRYDFQPGWQVFQLEINDFLMKRLEKQYEEPKYDFRFSL